MRTYNKTKSHQNTPRRNSAAEQNWNPINSSSMSTSDTGIVSLSKGNIFYDLNNNEGAKGTEFFSEVLVRDEYGNLVELLRSSDVEDTSELGSYSNNQTINNLPNKRLTYIDGRPSNAGRPRNITFTFSVDTNTTYEGSTTSTQFQLPLISSGTISMNVDWGDGTSDVITTYNQAETLHTYAASGVYTIKITNEVRGFRFINSGDKLKMNNISNWGQFNITSNMTSTATDSPIIESTSLYRTFRGCYLFNGVVNNWDTRGVSDIQQMFHDCRIFNQPLSNWNTSSVIYMNYIFANCDEFNQPLNNWDTSSAQRMFGVFFGTHKFNQPLNNWDVSSVTDMSYMFFLNYEFNQPLNNWNVSSVALTLNMFYQAYDFNQPLSFWDTSSITIMEGMFYYATNFNQDLGNWNIESVTNMNDIILGGTLGTSNYDSLLTGWLGSPTVIEPEFVTNGDFNDGLTGWTLTGAASATQTLVAGGLEMYSGTVAGNQNRMSQTSTPQGYINKTYTLTLDASDFVGSNAGYIRLNGYYDSSNIIRFTASTTSVTFKAYRDFTFIVFFAGGANKY
jgi:surface protein